MAFLNLPKDLVVGARASAYIDEATCHLHAGHDFEAGHFQVDGKNPLPECDLGPLQCRPDPDRECLPAAGAVVRQSGRPCGLTRVRASAPWAMATVRPYQGFKSCRGGILIGEHGGQLHER